MNVQHLESLNDVVYEITGIRQRETVPDAVVRQAEQIELVDMTPEESKPLIDYLVRHATRPKFCYRHQWRKDDIVLWDNRCTMHIALGDYAEGEIRHLERTTVKGTPSGYYLQ